MPTWEKGKIKILGIVLGILLLLDISLLIFYWQEKNQVQKSTSQISSQTLFEQEASPTPLATFFNPVEKTDLDKASLVQLDYGIDDLGFRLKEESIAYAGFAGRVSLAGAQDEPQKVIFLEDSSSLRRWKYFFSGDFLAKEGEKVAEGTPLAKVKGLLPTREENLIIQAYSGEKRESFSHDDLEKITIKQ